jgi:hypothetical protein
MTTLLPTSLALVAIEFDGGGLDRGSERPKCTNCLAGSNPATSTFDVTLSIFKAIVKDGEHRRHLLGKQCLPRQACQKLNDVEVNWMMQQAEVTPVAQRKRVTGLEYTIVGLPLESELRTRMILLRANDPEDWVILLSDQEFCELLAQSLLKAIEFFVRQRLSFVSSEEDIKDVVSEVFSVIWPAVRGYDPSRGVPLLVYSSPLLLRAFSAHNRQQRTRNREILVSTLWHNTDGSDDLDESPEDFWEIFPDGKDIEEEVIKRDELAKIAFLVGYQDPEELTEAIEKAHKVTRHRLRKKLISYRKKLVKQYIPIKTHLQQTKDYCDQCMEKLRTTTAFKAFGAKYLVAECPACHCRVVVPVVEKKRRKNASTLKEVSHL